MISDTQVLLKKDLLCLMRAKGGILSSFAFSLVSAVMAGFAFRRIGVQPEELQSLGAGLIWLIFMFSAVILLNQTFIFEQEESAIEGLILSPAQPASIFLSKFLSALVYVFSAHLFTIVGLGLFLGLTVGPIFWELSLIGLLAATGFVAIGVLLAAIASTVAARELLLPLLLFPITLPLLAGCVFISRELMLQGQLLYSNFWFVFICVFDIIAFSAAWVMFEYSLQE